MAATDIGMYRLGVTDPASWDAGSWLSDASQQHLNPLAGLAAFGPYSAGAWQAAGQQVRVAILAPHDAIDPVRGLLNSLRDTAAPQERADYLPPLPRLSGRVPHRAHPRR